MNARLFLLPVIDVRGLLSKVYIYVCIIVGRRLIVSASLIQTNAIIAGIWQARKEETVSTLLVTVNVFIRPRDRPFLLIKKRAWLRLSTSCRFFEQTNTLPLPSFLSLDFLISSSQLLWIIARQEIGQRVSLFLSITSPLRLDFDSQRHLRGGIFDKS